MRAKAFGYIRVSGKGQVGGHGPGRQKDIIEGFARKAGLQVVGWYRDVHTGTKEDRPAFVEMLEAILTNGTKVVIVESLDRFARDLMVQTMLLAKLEAEGITLLSASTGEDVTASMRDDPMKKAMVQIQGVFSELDKSLTVRKLRKARDRKREVDGRCEGRKPFGEKPGEAETLDRIKQLRRKPRGGKRRSFGQVAGILNAEGRPTRTGRPWSRSAVHKLSHAHGWVD